jgi:flavin-dependent dehydrogenase
VTITYGVGDSPDEASFDLVVGAFGLSRGTLRKMERLGFGYQAPQTGYGFQAHLEMPRATVDEFYQGGVHVFGPGLSARVGHAELIPGETGVTIRCETDGKFSRREFLEFLKESKKHGLVPEQYDENSEHCFCTRRVALAPARKPYSNRLVIVGDAAYSRLRGHGIESALTTSELAARTALTEGINAEIFARSYAPQAKRLLARDNSYGKAVHFLNGLFTSRSFLGRGQKKMLTDTAEDPHSRRLRELLWDFYTCESSYKALLTRFLAPGVVLSQAFSAVLTRSNAGKSR